jgi:hypothetical protein
MQPLSRVNPDAIMNWGIRNAIAERPTVGVKVAECIAEWAEIETVLGLFLAMLLHANEKAALAMYSAVENRAAQLRMITSAAKSTLRPSHFDVISVLLTATVRPCMKDRDRLAHWCWGYSAEVPDALLITEPSNKLALLLNTVTNQAKGAKPPPTITVDFSKVFVLRAEDLARTLTRFVDALDGLQLAIASVWSANSQQSRDGFLQTLSSKPQIRLGLLRLAENRQKNPTTPQPPPEQDQNGEK